MTRHPGLTPDLLVAGGTVVDGSGSPPVQADVAVEGGRIVGVGAFPEARPKRTLDATGLLVAPGFIDIHSHSDFTLAVDPRAVSSIAQGVTTEVVGNCGHGCAPIGNAELAKSNIYGYRDELGLHWDTMDGYLSFLEERAPAVNVATLVPNGNLRLSAAGMSDRADGAAELAQMKRLLEESLEAGAFGYSTGLEYGLERGCSEQEVTALCHVCHSANGLYATHTRNLPDQAREAIAEPIRSAAAADVPLQISHISVVARLADDGGWAVAQALEQARRSGIDVTFDMHTRLFGTTNLSAALPPRLLSGTRNELAAELSSDSARAELAAYPSIIRAVARDQWDRVLITECTTHPEWNGESVAAIAASRGVPPFDAVLDLLLEEIDDIHRVMIIANTYREEDLRQAFEHPDCMIGSDATALAPDGTLRDSTFHGAYTWAAWFYRHFVRERRALTPQAAVRRLTSLPAGRMGITDRGTIETGNWADLAVFDPGSFGECGTVSAPNRVAAGMVHVVVNGVVSMEAGGLSADRGGEVLRREER